MTGRWTSMKGIGGLAVVTVAAAGCGSTTSSTTSSGSGGGSNTVCATQAASIVAGLRQPIQPNVPAAPVQMSANAGKTIWFIAATMSIPLIVSISQGAQAAAKAAGMKVVVFDGKGQVNTFNTGVQEAVAAHADGIILQAVNPSDVSGPLAQAFAAGIPVVDTFNGNPGDPLNGLYAHVTRDFGESGKWMADYVLADSHCNADAVVFEENIFHVNVLETQGATQEFQRLCPSCKVNTQDVDVSTVATTAGSLAQTAVARDPKVNYLIPVSDGIALYMVPAIDQSASGKVKIVSHDGAPENLDFIRKGQSQIADISFPEFAYIGWLQVDEMGRAFQHLPAANDSIPAQLFDKTNLPATDDTSALFPAFANYEAKFLQVWGLG